MQKLKPKEVPLKILMTLGITVDMKMFAVKIRLNIFYISYMS